MANRRPVVFTVGETELDSAENSVEESILQSEDFREKLELLEAYRREKEMVGVSWINGRSYQIVKPTLRAILAARGYLVGQKLGSGRYSKVIRAEDFSRGSHGGFVAVKIINGAKVHRDFWEKFLPRELHNWWHLSHDNIVGLRARFKEASWTFMVAEYLDGGDLLDFVQKTNLTESLAHSYVKQIFEAVRYLHVDKNLAHRDLKLENILMSADRKTVKLADFGFSRRVSSSELVKTTCGSKAYMSPDILRGEPYDPKKADVWSLGVITFILVSGRMPFDESVGTLGLLRAQRDRTYRYPLDMPVSHDCRQFIHDLLTFEETNRPDVATASKFSWIVRNSIGLKTC